MFFSGPASSSGGKKLQAQWKHTPQKGLVARKEPRKQPAPRRRRGGNPQYDPNKPTVGAEETAYGFYRPAQNKKIRYRPGTLALREIRTLPEEDKPPYQEVTVLQSGQGNCTRLQN